LHGQDYCTLQGGEIVSRRNRKEDIERERERERDVEKNLDATISQSHMKEIGIDFGSSH
jgi:hypothetical protein